MLNNLSSGLVLLGSSSPSRNHLNSAEGRDAAEQLKRTFDPCPCSGNDGETLSCMSSGPSVQKTHQK